MSLAIKGPFGLWHSPLAASVSKRVISAAASSASKCLAVVLLRPFSALSLKSLNLKAAGLAVFSVRIFPLALLGVFTLSKGID